MADERFNDPAFLAESVGKAGKNKYKGEPELVERPVVNKPKEKFGKSAAAMKDFLLDTVSPVRQGRKMLDTMRVGINAAAFGALDEASGVGAGINEMLTNGEFGEGFEKGRAQSQGASAAAEERLNPLERFGIEAGAGLSKRTPVGALANLADKAIGRGQKVDGAIASGLRLMRDMGIQGLAGGVEGGIRGTLDNMSAGKNLIENITELGYGEALQGAGLGAGGQALIGSLLPKLGKYGIGLGFAGGQGKAEQNVAEAILDRGNYTGEGVTPATIRAQYPEMIEKDIGLISTGAGDQSPAVITNRVADLVAEAEFPQSADTHQFEAFSNKYLQTMGHINQIVDETKARITGRFDKILGSPREASAQRGRNLAPQLRKYQDTYSSLKSTKLGTVGGKEVGYRSTIDSLDTSIADDMGYASVSDMSSAEGDVYSTLVNEIRPKGQYQHTRGLHRLPHDDVLGTDLDTAQTKLNSLMNAREALSETYQVGQLKEGTAVNPKQFRAASIMIKNLDKQIADLSGNLSTEARENFAKWMRVNDAEEAGAAFYTGRLSEDPNYGVNAKEYLAQTGDADIEQAFKEGYSGAMALDMTRRHPHQVMSEIAGDVSRKDLDGLSADSVGLSNLRTVLGDETADSLIRETTSDLDFDIASKKLRGYLEAKHVDPSRIDDLVRSQDDLLIATGINPALGATLFATSTLGAIGRRAKAMGVDEAELAMRLAGDTGKAATETMEQILRRFEMPERISAGGMSVLGGDDPEAQEANESEYSRAVQDYLFNSR